MAYSFYNFEDIDYNRLPIYGNGPELTYAIILSRFLTSKQEFQKKYKEIEGPLMSLAHRYYHKPMALYFYLRTSKGKDLFEHFEYKYKTVNSVKVKTPEEWIISAEILYFWEKCTIDNKEMSMAEAEHNFRKEYQATLKKNGSVDMKKFSDLYKRYQNFFNSPYFLTIQRVREGFYKRAFIQNRPEEEAFIDKCEWVCLSNLPYNLKCLDGIPYRDNVGKVEEELDSAFIQYDSDKYPSHKFHYGKMLLQSSDENKRKFGMSLLGEVASLELPIDYSKAGGIDELFQNIIESDTPRKKSP